MLVAREPPTCMRCTGARVGDRQAFASLLYDVSYGPFASQAPTPPKMAPTTVATIAVTIVRLNAGAGLRGHAGAGSLDAEGGVRAGSSCSPSPDLMTVSEDTRWHALVRHGGVIGVWLRR